MHRGCKASKAQRKIALRRLLDGASMWTRHGGAEHGVGSQLSIVEARGHQVLDVIDFLETLGQDAQLRYASRDEVGFALAGAEMEPALQVAILAKKWTGVAGIAWAEAVLLPDQPGQARGGTGGV